MEGDAEVGEFGFGGFELGGGVGGGLLDVGIREHENHAVGGDDGTGAEDDLVIGVPHNAAGEEVAVFEGDVGVGVLLGDDFRGLDEGFEDDLRRVAAGDCGEIRADGAAFIADALGANCEALAAQIRAAGGRPTIGMGDWMLAENGNMVNKTGDGVGPSYKFGK